MKLLGEVLLVTGAAAWAIALLISLWLLAEILMGLVAALSWSRWQLALSRHHREKRDWRKFPLAFLRVWWLMIGYRAGAVTMRSKNGVWNGIGRWVVYRHGGASDVPHP